MMGYFTITEKNPIMFVALFHRTIMPLKEKHST